MLSPFMYRVGRQNTLGIPSSFVPVANRRRDRRRSRVALSEQGQVEAMSQVGCTGETTAQALHRGELGLGFPLDLQGTLEQVRMMFLKPEDLVLLAGRAEEASRLHRHGQAGTGDDLFAPLPVKAPLNEGIPVPILFILLVTMPATVSRAGVVADGLEDFATATPARLRRRPTS